MRNYFLFFFLLLFFNSCQKDAKNNIDTSIIEVDFMMYRFEQDFYENKGDNLEVLKENFPLLFPKNTPDSVWIAKIQDKDEQELYKETQKVYSSFSDIETELTTLFKHITYYNPTFNAPDIITVLSNIDYEYRVVFTDLLVLISIDVYLGEDHPFYNEYPSYIKQNNNREPRALCRASTAGTTKCNRQDQRWSGRGLDGSPTALLFATTGCCCSGCRCGQCAVLQPVFRRQLWSPLRV